MSLKLSELSVTKLVPTREILMWTPTRERIAGHLLLIPQLKVVPTREHLVLPPIVTERRGCKIRVPLILF